MSMDTAAAQASAVRDGQVSARELVEAALAAIAELNPQLNAVVTLCEERALAEADAIAAGDPRLLAGVPVAIKDAVCLTEGVRTTHGSRALGEWVPDRDSPVVARLRRAGAIVVGKTSTPELAGRPVCEPARFGPARNPWDPERTPGGSSGGSAAAVASGMLAIAHGNDLSGSIRIPASCCGVVGLKPCGARVPADPDFAFLGHMVSDGVLTRTVLDTALALDAIAGPVAGEGWWPEPPQGTFAEAAIRSPGRLKVLVCRHPPLGRPVEGAPASAVEGAARLLDSLGHDVEVATPDWDDEGFYEHWDVFQRGVLPRLVAAIGRARGAPLDPAELEPPARELMTESAPVTLERFQEASEAIGRLARRILVSWPPGGVLVTPTIPRLPPLVGGLAPGEGTAFGDFTRWFNFTGQPAISLPLAESIEHLPVGVQITGPPMGEELLLSLAAQIEDATPWRPAGRPALWAHAAA